MRIKALILRYSNTMQRIFLTFVLILTLILCHAEKMALVSVPVACMRDSASHKSELVSQAVMGTPVKVDDSEWEEWMSSETPDGYKGYINRSSLTVLTDSAFSAWKHSPRLFIPGVKDVVVKDSVGVVSVLLPGSIIEKGEGSSVKLPDGRTGTLEDDIAVRFAPESFSKLDYDRIISEGQLLMGTPYLWGGMSVHAMDCSGYVRILFGSQGCLLPRDASQQALCGMEVSDPQRGDLLFFKSKPDGGITHVAIYNNNGEYIHCSGQVKRSSMTADDPDFSKRILSSIRRITNKNIQSFTLHPRYY